MSNQKKKSWFAKHKVLTAIIVVVVIIGIAGSGDSSSSEINSTLKSNTEVEKQAKTEMTYEEINTLTLIKEFDNNQLSAEKKYKDKGVQLTAKIKNISEDILGSPFLSLEPKNAEEYYFGTNIQCMFDNADDLLNVSNGQIVTIKGIVGEQSLGIIGLDKCQIIE